MMIIEILGGLWEIDQFCDIYFLPEKSINKMYLNILIYWSIT